MSEPFRHEALFYSSEDELLAGVVPFVREGLAAEEPILVAVASRTLELLRSACPTADPIAWIDLDEIGRNPGRVLAVWHAFAGPDAGPPTRGVGEPLWPGRTADERGECHRHEHLLNVAFKDRAGLRLLCPYDVCRLNHEDFDQARASHPYVAVQGQRNASGLGVDGFSTLEGDLSEIAGDPVELAVAEPGSLAALRDLVRRQARADGIPAERVGDVVLAVDEVASNSLVYGGGEALARIWPRDGEIVCEVRDRGLIRDPLVGRIPPSRASAHGRGLWIVNQLCDLVELRSSEAGTVVRIRVAGRSGDSPRA